MHRAGDGTAEGWGDDSSKFYIGFATAADEEASVCFVADHGGVDPADTRTSNTRCITIIADDGSGTLDADAELKEFKSDTFVVTWKTTDP